VQLTLFADAPTAPTKPLLYSTLINTTSIQGNYFTQSPYWQQLHHNCDLIYTSIFPNTEPTLDDQLFPHHNLEVRKKNTSQACLRRLHILLPTPHNSTSSRTCISSPRAAARAAGIRSSHHHHHLLHRTRASHEIIATPSLRRLSSAGPRRGSWRAPCCPAATTRCTPRCTRPRTSPWRRSP
jgi:hypothetical protein